MQSALASVLAIACAACSSPGASPARPAPPPAPRLVVVLVLDQWPQWAFEQKRPALERGFARLLGEGEWRVGVHPSAAALTAPGHAVIGTGAPPARSGIVANRWWSREHRRYVSAARDPDDRVAPTWLRVAGLGDAVAAADRGGKAIGVSLKPHAALLPLGRRGTAIWYEPRAMAWASRPDVPWLAEHARAHPIAPRLAPWTPLDPARIAALANVPDAAPGELGEKGFGPAFPHDPANAESPGEAVLAMPLGNELVLELAEAALVREQLGADAAPDLLVVSLSSHDHVGHGWGQESWEMWDMTLRLDARLDAFLAALDRAAGAGGWAMIVTSDHGASPLPETLGGGRFTHRGVQLAANRGAERALGPGDWVATAHFPTLYLSDAARALPGAELERALDAMLHEIRAVPGVARADRTSAIAGGCEARTGDERALCWMIDRERSGELYFVPARGWVVESERDRLATAHGSLHAYDREVPVLLLPPGRTRGAGAAAPSGTMPMTDLAPLVARWLGAPPPGQLRPE